MTDSDSPRPKSADRRTLANVALLRSLDETERHGLQDKCAWRRYRAGERVFERGSDSREVFFIVEGEINIVSFAPTGREVTFASGTVGDIVGELAAIDGEPRSASVVATQDSLLAVMPSEVFVDVIKQHGEIAFLLLRRLSSMVRHVNRQVLEVSGLKAANRVYTELLRLAQPDSASPDLLVIRPLPALRVLANKAGTTRELVSKALNRLYPTGLIRRKGDRLYIIDRAALEDIVKAAADAGDA